MALICGAVENVVVEFPTFGCRTWDGFCRLQTMVQADQRPAEAEVALGRDATQ